MPPTIRPGSQVWFKKGCGKNCCEIGFNAYLWNSADKNTGDKDYEEKSSSQEKYGKPEWFSITFLSPVILFGLYASLWRLPRPTHRLDRHGHLRHLLVLGVVVLVRVQPVTPLHLLLLGVDVEGVGPAEAAPGVWTRTGDEGVEKHAVGPAPE